MATDKRDRQRANREAKQAQQEKAAKRARLFGQIKKYGGYALLFAASLIAFRFFFGSG